MLDSNFPKCLPWFSKVNRVLALGHDKVNKGYVLRKESNNERESNVKHIGKEGSDIFCNNDRV